MNDHSTLPQIRRLVEESRMTHTEVANLAKVRYQNLRRFMLGETENYNFMEAEMVFHALTGKPFSTPGVPLKRSLRKGRAA